MKHIHIHMYYASTGVIIDHPTAFTMGEMGNVYGTLAHNLLFRGGDAGNDSAILLHSYGDESEAMDGSGSMIQIACGDQIGTSGVFEGMFCILQKRKRFRFDTCMFLKKNL